MTKTCWLFLLPTAEITKTCWNFLLPTAEITKTCWLFLLPTAEITKTCWLLLLPTAEMTKSRRSFLLPTVWQYHLSVCFTQLLTFRHRNMPSDLRKQIQSSGNGQDGVGSGRYLSLVAQRTNINRFSLLCPRGEYCGRRNQDFLCW